MPPDIPLKIAMLSAHSCPVGQLGTKDTGGMSVYIVELARELGRQGHLVDVYTRVHDPRDEQTYELGQNARLIHLRAGEPGEMHKLAVYSYLPDFACGLENFRKENNLQYNLVFSHYWLSGWAGQYPQQWWHVPHVAMFHTIGAVKNDLGIGEDEPELRIETERYLAQNCHLIIAATERERGEIVRRYDSPPEKISVIPCGVNLELFQPVDKNRSKHELGLPDDKIILFAGRLEPLKGVDRLLKAMTYLPASQKPRLVIVGGEGNSAEMEELQRQSRKLKISDSVIFRGLIKHEQMPLFYSAADICVLPSYYESFGLVALESLACGTPVIATDVGDLKNIIRQGETGYVLADNEPRQLAEKIALLLSRPTPDAESILALRASVSRFSWTNIAGAVISQFQRLLADYLAAVP